MVPKYKKGSAWKRANWDKWTLGKKIRHCIAVFFSGLTVIAMFLAFLWLALFLFGVQGFMTQFRDAILLDLMKWLFN